MQIIILKKEEINMFNDFEDDVLLEAMLDYEESCAAKKEKEESCKTKSEGCKSKTEEVEDLLDEEDIDLLDDYE